MKRALLLIATLALTAVSPTPAPTHLRVIDLMPEFWRIYDANAPVAEKVKAFKERIVAPNAEAYADGEFAANLADDAAIARYLTGLKPIAPAMREVSAQLAREVPVLEASFAKALPDFQSGNITIFFMPSFHHFNAQVHDFGKGSGVFFGVDGIVEFDGAHPNVGVNVAHELFHIYHFEMHPGVSTDAYTLWQAMWSEGLAAYASRQLTPGSTQAQALGAQLASAPAAHVRRLACGISDHWTSRNQSVINEYIDNGAHPAGLPARGAYLIGYLAAADLGKRSTLSQLGKAGPEIEPQLAARVGTLCRRGTL